MNDLFFTASLSILSMFVGLFGGLIAARESAKTQLTISEYGRLQQMKLAALKERLAKHQEAYALFYELFWCMDKADEVGKAVIKCQTWWVNNGLYLDARSRQSFKVGYHLALHHRLAAESRDMKTAHESFDKIMQVFQDLEKGVDLTPSGVTPDKEKIQAAA